MGVWHENIVYFFMEIMFDLRVEKAFKKWTHYTFKLGAGSAVEKKGTQFLV